MGQLEMLTEVDLERHARASAAKPEVLSATNDVFGLLAGGDVFA